MNFNSFTFQLLFRLSLIILLIVSSIQLNISGDYYTTSFLLFSISAGITASLVSFLNRVNRDFTRFTLAVKNNDFQENFTKPANESFKELYNAFNDVREKFITERSEKEERYHLLQTVVEHIKVALISFKENGEVDIYNQAARKLFNIPFVRNISDLNEFDDSFVNSIKKLERNTKQLLNIHSPEGSHKLSIEITEFKQNYETYRLVSIQDIKMELDQHELDTWQKLIRVLNHEIFNSITPIISLSETTSELIHSFDEMSTSDLNDMKKAFTTIEKRGKHLLNFVNQFRSITHLPEPTFEIVSVSDVLERLTTLFNNELNELNIDFKTEINPSSIEITADISMLEQILINLIKNAIDAIRNIEFKKIQIVVEFERNHPTIKIIDSGKGISEDILDKLFIPFFTTKQTGSGIGLSLSKQLMKLNNGDIKVTSRKGKTEFVLHFYL